MLSRNWETSSRAIRNYTLTNSLCRLGLYLSSKFKVQNRVAEFPDKLFDIDRFRIFESWNCVL
jgi:hypothetical protein